VFHYITYAVFGRHEKISPCYMKAVPSTAPSVSMT